MMIFCLFIKYYCKSATGIFIIHYEYFATLNIDDLFCEGESQSVSVLLMRGIRLIEFIKYVILYLVADSGALVGDGKDYFLTEI